MQYDWLLGIPRAPFEEQLAWIKERFEEEPEAAEITDLEAEQFFSMSYILRFMAPGTRNKLARALGIRVSGGGENITRLFTMTVLRRWKEPKTRELLIYLIPNTAPPGWPDLSINREWWTEEFFHKAYAEKGNVVWLVQIRRYLGRVNNDLEEWLNSLDEWAARDYRFWLDVARLAMRRILYPKPAGNQNRVAASAQSTAAELQEKDKQTGSLRQNVRLLEQDRKQLRERARRAEQQAKEMLSQARGEVSASRRALAERLKTQQQERASQAQRYEREIARLREQLKEARCAFAGVLAQQARNPWGVLGGRTLSVSESGGDEEIYRLMIESLGGTLVHEGGDIVLSGVKGFAALEQRLKEIALQKVLIKCDGLYRRKDGRFGVSVAAFQVHVGQEVIHQEARVVGCGPWAGSLMAEYGAVVMALHWLISVQPPLGAELVVWSDCRALLSRLRRTRNVRRKWGCVTLDQTARRAQRALRQQGRGVRLCWVPREEVDAVDRLCDRAYRELGWYHRRGGKPHKPLSSFLRTVCSTNPGADGSEH